MKDSRITRILKTFHRPMKKNQNSMRQGKASETITVAHTYEMRKKAYNLLYRTYLEKEYLPVGQLKMSYSINDACEKTFTVISKQSGNIVGALTVVFNDELPLPAYQLYQREIIASQKTPNSICEITSLAIDKNVDNGFELLKNMFHFAWLVSSEIMKCSGFIITINPKHQRFYEQKLLFKQIGLVKQYEKVGGAPAVLLHLDFSVISNAMNSKPTSEDSKIMKRTFYYKAKISYETNQQLLEKFKYYFSPMQPEEIEHFFKVEPEVWMSLSKNERIFINKKILQCQILA